MFCFMANTSAKSISRAEECAAAFGGRLWPQQANDGMMNLFRVPTLKNFNTGKRTPQSLVQCATIGGFSPSQSLTDEPLRLLDSVGNQRAP